MYDSRFNWHHGDIVLSKFLKYLHRSNPTPQQKLSCNYFQKSDILAYFPLVRICRGGNLQIWCLHFSVISLLIRFHCMYLFYLIARNLKMHNYCLCVPDCVQMTNIIDWNRWEKCGVKILLNLGKFTGLEKIIGYIGLFFYLTIYKSSRKMMFF